MALRAVIDHPKFARLKMLLKTNKSGALGYLEGLWHFCGRYTPAGNLGKYSNEEIEAWLEWDGEDGALIAAYVRAGWVDVDPAHRLVVHDWHHHADDATRAAVKRAKLTFVGACPDTIAKPADAVAEVADDVPTQSAEAVQASGLPVPGPVPVPEPKTPPTPLAGEAAPQRDAEDATAQARRVLRERGLSDQRLEPVIAKALTLAIDTGGGTAASWADTMIANHARYVADVDLLRFACGARKFFQSSLWRGEGWPYDGKLVEARRRASVGRASPESADDAAAKAAAREAEEAEFREAMGNIEQVLQRRDRGEPLSEMEFSAVIQHGERQRRAQQAMS